MYCTAFVLQERGPAYRNRTHIHGVEDRCIIHYTKAGKYYMQLILTSTLDSSKQLIIDLLNNPAINRWITMSTFDTCFLNNNPIIHELSCSTAELDFQFRKIKESFDKFKKFKSLIDVPIPIIRPFYLNDQHWCNDVHNVFLEITRYLKNKNDNYLYSTDPLELELLNLGRDINHHIHIIERYTDLTQNEIAVSKNYQHNIITTLMSNSSRWISFTKEEQTLYHTRYNDIPHNVVFSNYILGKTFLAGFLNDEKIEGYRVNGTDGTYGHFDIVLDDNRQKIYRSPEFHSWIAKHHINIYDVLLEFPLGDIEDLSTLDYFKQLPASQCTIAVINGAG